MDVLEPVVAWNNDTAAIGLVARRGDVSAVDALPASVALSLSACGCLLEVPVVLNCLVSTWAIKCEHTSPAKSR